MYNMAKKNKVVLLSFASSNMQNTLNRLRREAERCHFFDTVFTFSELDFDDDYWQENKDYFQTQRGFGFWIWKPYLADQIMQRLQEGDILVYVDAGCKINKSGKELFDKYINSVNESPLGFVVFSNDCVEKEWDKGDVLDFMGVRDNAEILNSSQIMGGVWLARKCCESSKLIQDWMNITHKKRHLVDDTSSISHNEIGFVQNRHDQSIFSLLIKKSGGAIVYPCSDVEVGGYNKQLTERILRKYKGHPILVVRDRSSQLVKSRSPRVQILFNCAFDTINAMESVFEVVLRYIRKMIMKFNSGMDKIR